MKECTRHKARNDQGSCISNSHPWLWISQPWFESTSRSRNPPACPSQQRCDAPLPLGFRQADEVRRHTRCFVVSAETPEKSAAVGHLITITTSSKQDGSPSRRQEVSRCLRTLRMPHRPPYNAAHIPSAATPRPSDSEPAAAVRNACRTPSGCCAPTPSGTRPSATPATPRT